MDLSIFLRQLELSADRPSCGEDGEESTRDGECEGKVRIVMWRSENWRAYGGQYLGDVKTTKIQSTKDDTVHRHPVIIDCRGWARWKSCILRSSRGAACLPLTYAIQISAD